MCVKIGSAKGTVAEVRFFSESNHFWATHSLMDAQRWLTKEGAANLASNQVPRQRVLPFGLCCVPFQVGCWEQIKGCTSCMVDCKSADTASGSQILKSGAYATSRSGDIAGKKKEMGSGRKAKAMEVQH